MSPAVVQIEALSKEFYSDKPPALQDVHAHIEKGKIVGLVGPDGAGKTTLLRLIAALLRPTKGKITVVGYDSVKDAEKIHFITGYMPQKFGLYEDLSVLQNLNLYANLRSLGKEERKEKFEQLLKFTALAPFTKRLAGALSGGMKQKLGLACALIKKPTLLLLDEPSVGVDPVSRRELWRMVHDLIAEGISVVWSTAYLDEAEACDSVLLLNEGKVLFEGTSQALTERVKGRVFKLTEITHDRRRLLSEVLLREGVIDGVIQGQDVRIVVGAKGADLNDLNAAIPRAGRFGEFVRSETKPNRSEATRTTTPFPNREERGGGTIWQSRSKYKFTKPDGARYKLMPTTPRFEDAFIDILGGGPKGESELAKITPEVKAGSDIVVKAEGLTKRFGSFTAADRVSFEIRHGEIFGLLGPNGAGKSTTFKMLCGLLRPTEGRAFVGEYDLQKAPAEGRARIGYMAQKFSLYGNLSVLQNLHFFAGAYNLVGAKKEEKIAKMVEIFSLQKYVHTSSELLPLGFKQRLALACATMHAPQVLFLDEPTSGVDPLTRREFWNHINGLVGKGVTVMVTTHFMDEAEYCDRIALVYRGRVIHMQTPDQLKLIAQSEENPHPTLEDAFIQLIEEYDRTH